MTETTDPQASFRAVFTVTVETRKGGDYYFDHGDLVRNVTSWIEGGLEDRDDIRDVTVVDQAAELARAQAEAHQYRTALQGVARAAVPSAPADRPAFPPAAEGFREAVLDSATDGASALDAWARTPHGRNFLAHGLVQLARDGWLRAEAGEGFEVVRDRETPEPEDPASLPPAADRAAILREAFTAVGAMDFDGDATDYGYDSFRDAWNGGVVDARDLLRRMVDEAQQTAPWLSDSARIGRTLIWTWADIGKGVYGQGYRAAQTEARTLLTGQRDSAEAQQPEDETPPALLRRTATDCPGFPDHCPNLLAFDPNPSTPTGGIRCGCADEEAATWSPKEA